MGIFDKAKDLASEHPDQVNEGIEKAGDFADEKTGGKYEGQVDQGQDFLRNQAGGDQAENADNPENPGQ